MNPVVESTGWRKRLEDAIENEVEFGSDKHYELENLALSWESCAVGENVQQLKQKGYVFEDSGGLKDVYPKMDDVHEVLGMEFTERVKDGDYEGALDVLTEIENLPPVVENEDE